MTARPALIWMVILAGVTFGLVSGQAVGRETAGTLAMLSGLTALALSVVNVRAHVSEQRAGMSAPKHDAAGRMAPCPRDDEGGDA